MVTTTPAEPTFIRLSEARLLESAGALAEVLVDAVEDGASIGFLAPLDPTAAVAWWREQAPAVAAGTVIIWAAAVDGQLSGTIALKLEDMPNGRHRAEVKKLMVHRRARRRGLGRQLLTIAEAAAGAAGSTLLLLDTQTGSAADALYRAAGWTAAGVIPDYAADPAGVLQPTTIFYKACR